MPHRTDAGRVTIRRLLVVAALLAGGCSSPGGGMHAFLASRAPQPAAVQPPKPITPPVVQPVGNTAPTPVDTDPLGRLAAEATEQHALLSSYTCRLRRREAGREKPKPEELIVFRWRAQPWSLSLKWISEEGKGREVVYVQGDPKLHILTAAGDIPFMAGGKRMDLAHDSPLVKAASRHAITEAGLNTTIQKYVTLLAATRRGDAPGVTYQYLGLVQRPEYPYPLEAVTNGLPPGHLPECPKGGKRTLFFDPRSKLPVVFELFDDAGKELEYHCFDRFQFNAPLDGDDFNPDKLWAGPAKP